MALLLLRENDVKGLLTMDLAIKALEDVFKEHSCGKAQNLSRERLRSSKGILHLMAASVPSLGAMGYKAYTSFGGTTKFLFMLYSCETGELLSIMEADYLGITRTGAASALATKYMAKEDAASVALYGTGKQAWGQLRGICAVRKIKRAAAYSRDAERRKNFCHAISKELGIEVVPAQTPSAALEGADIVVTVTTSREPVFDGELLAEGTHINAVGANSLIRQEIGESGVRKCNVIAVDSAEQVKMESGDFLAPVEKGRLQWGELIELGDIVAGWRKGRNSNRDITLFKSLGIAIEDVAVGAGVYKLAREAGLGQEINF